MKYLPWVLSFLYEDVLKFELILAYYRSKQTLKVKVFCSTTYSPLKWMHGFQRTCNALDLYMLHVSPLYLILTCAQITNQILEKEAMEN